VLLVGYNRTHAVQHDPCKKRERCKAVSQKANRMFGSGGCALGFFDLDVASDGIEYGHLRPRDRCDGIVDGEGSVFAQLLGIIRSAFNACIMLPLGYFRLEIVQWRNDANSTDKRGECPGIQKLAV